MKLCILTAGMGTRMGRWEQLTHKALLPVGDKAVLSHILSTFPRATEIVIVLGHRGHLIREYISVAHPEAPVTFVTVDRFVGPGAGPGHSLWCARHLLQECFVFTACDSIIGRLSDDVAGNWVGVVKVEDVQPWCSVIVDETDLVRGLVYKQPAPTSLAFVGVAAVADYEVFWDALTPRGDEATERQVNDGLSALIPAGLKARVVEWIDTGNAEHYARAIRTLGAMNFEGKINEITYRVGERVIKYLPTAGRTQLVTERAAQHAEAFAEVLDHTEHFIALKFYPASLLAEVLDGPSVTSFLQWAQALLWRDIEIAEAERERVGSAFYVEKTLQRLQSYAERFGPEAQSVTINGEACPSVHQQLMQVSQLLVSNMWPSTFHGDLHDENILCTSQGLRLIDWRDSFGGQSVWGDRYYDLAKFFHTLDLSVETMRRGEFELREESGGFSVSHHRSSQAIQAEHAFWQFAEEAQYVRRNILILNGIVFVNMAPLYDPPMAEYLYLLGRYRLQRAIRGEF